AAVVAMLENGRGSPDAKNRGEGTLAGDTEAADNESKPGAGRDREDAGNNGKPIWSRLGTYKIPFFLGMLPLVVLIYILSAPTLFSTYTRECEYPDEYSVGQTLERSQASGSTVHGQFGAVPGPTWPSQAGYATYNTIMTA